MKIRKKYKKEWKEMIDDLLLKGINTCVLSIDVVGVSKIKGHLLYKCVLLDNSVVKEVPIIAIDVTQALAKLEPYVNIGIPEETLKYMLGNERRIC